MHTSLELSLTDVSADGGLSLELCGDRVHVAYLVNGEEEGTQIATVNVYELTGAAKLLKQAIDSTYGL